MKLARIISMANATVRLPFLAMERSLRAVGCRLPLWVIPYDEDLFELPAGARWWAMPEMVHWLRQERARPVMRKYQCLTVDNYQFVDADVCFLRNPEGVLEPHRGFITSCCHWHNPDQTLTPETKRYLEQQSTTWQKRVFNSGQFACEQSLYQVPDLIALAGSAEGVKVCLRFPFHEQPGLNFLVWKSKVEITNLTLCSPGMESTWAGDYAGAFEPFWSDPSRKPYLIHWAGTPKDVPRPINEIFLNYLTQGERQDWERQVQQAAARRGRTAGSWRSRIRRIKRASQAFVAEWRKA
jgi:hypothetical protein